MLENRIFEVSETGRAFRIVLDKEDYIYCYPLDKSRRVEMLSRDFFDDYYRTGKFVFVPDPGPEIPVAGLTEKQKKRRDQNFDRIDEIWNESKNNLVKETGKTPCLEKWSRKTGVSMNTLLNHLDIYLKNGMVRDAFIPKYQNCSGRNKSNLNTPGVRPDHPKIPLEFMEPIYEHYARRKKNKVKNGKPSKTHWADIERDIKQELFTGEDCVTESFYPGYRQLTYWSRHKKDKRKADISEMGFIDAYNNKRLLRGTEDEYLFGAGSLWEIDATVLDFAIVDELNRTKPLTSPKLITVIDVDTRYIVGFYVFLESDSWREEVNGLLSAVLPIDQLGKRYGVHIDPGKGRASGFLPKFMRADRGPFLSRYEDQLLNTYNVHVQHPGTGLASGKGVVERRFLHINDIITSYLSGAKSSKGQARGEKDPSTRAKFTLNELFEAIYYVVDYLNHKRIDGFELTREMVSAGVDAVPAQLWDFSVANNVGQFREIDPDKFVFNLLPRESRQITRLGIRFKNDRYSGGNAQAAHYLREHRGERIDFVYDPKQTGYITILDPSGLKFDIPKVTKDPLKRNSSESENWIYREKEKEIRRDNEKDQTENERRLKKRLESLEKEVSGPKGKTPGKPKEKRKNTAEAVLRNRDTEEMVATVEQDTVFDPSDNELDFLDSIIKSQQSGTENIQKAG